MDPELIQVNASRADLKSRIDAFSRRKRALLDRANQLEFRGEGGAARVAAVMARSKGSKGHLRRSRVEDASSQAEERPVKAAKMEFDAPPAVPLPLENRLSELEEQVFFREQEPVPLSVYGRLRELEDRLQELLAISPEHFDPLEVVRGRDRQLGEARRKEARSAQVAADLKNINTRIAELSSKLRTKIESA